MAVELISRIIPADLQQVQVQANVGAAGLLTAVIQSLQFNKNELQPEEAPLNTDCPTCAVADVAKGFISGTLNGQTIKTICPTCAGYLLYYTEGGAETPPTNPFNAPLVVTRLLPADLVEAMDAFGSSTTLSAMITSLQQNVPEDAPVPTNNCPQCTHTGWINSTTICPLCSGMQKTVLLYSLVGGQYVPQSQAEPMPDPLPDASVLAPPFT